MCHNSVVFKSNSPLSAVETPLRFGRCCSAVLRIRDIPGATTTTCALPIPCVAGTHLERNSLHLIPTNTFQHVALQFSQEKNRTSDITKLPALDAACTSSDSLIFVLITDRVAARTSTGPAIAMLVSPGLSRLSHLRKLCVQESRQVWLRSLQSDGRPPSPPSKASKFAGLESLDVMGDGPQNTRRVSIDGVFFRFGGCF